MIAYFYKLYIILFSYETVLTATVTSSRSMSFNAKEWINIEQNVSLGIINSC